MSIDKREKDKRYNHLAAAEMGEEENYNMIDGIINNVRKPSLLEQMAEYERMIVENGSNDGDSEKRSISSSREK